MLKALAPTRVSGVLLLRWSGDIFCALEEEGDLPHAFVPFRVPAAVVVVVRRRSSK